MLIQSNCNNKNRSSTKWSVVLLALHSTGIKYFHPGQAHERIPGKLYYLLLLDTAASIEDPALKDFDFFLQNLTVE